MQVRVSVSMNKAEYPLSPVGFYIARRQHIDTQAFSLPRF